MNAYISAILPKKMRKWGSKRKKKIFLATPTTPHFFGSLGVAEHGKNGEHALSVAKILSTKSISNILCDFFPSL